MKSTFAVLGALLALSDPLPAGTITGTVHAAGAPAPDDPAGTGNYQSRRYKFAEKVDYDRLTDFVVYVDEPPGGVTTASSPSVAVTTQKNAMFEPHVLAIAAGPTMKSPNQADIHHNTSSNSQTKE